MSGENQFFPSSSASSLPYDPSTTAQEDDEYLDISEQKNRPEGTPIQSQTINAWHPILDPNWVIFSYLILAMIMIPFGYYLVSESDKIIELKQVYDAGNETKAACESIGENYNANANCTLTYEIPADMKPPVLVYYEITNFHQNYNKYVSSRDDSQLTGRVGDQGPIEAAACEPLNQLGDTVINPCGLIANTFFNDRISLVNSDSAVDDEGASLVMKEEGIAWSSDLQHRFAMPDGYNSKICPEGQCDSSCCEDNGFSCTEPAVSPKDGQCYAYDYPEQNTTQYLYQTYPSIISPLEHVTNEHFVVWMRVAATPNFRKLYGYFEQTIPAGTKLEFEVNMNWVVQSFKGSKALTLTTTSTWGTKNPLLGMTIYTIGYFCLVCGFFFGMKHWFKPRKIADRKYLHFKEE
mmetsp:Transcript_21465/g.51184  ORF Transcript_21465/g.51184 Transcript_21465/m.51184 type:complete len:407 (+) Transcript_21465:59-1279(+)